MLFEGGGAFVLVEGGVLEGGGFGLEGVLGRPFGEVADEGFSVDRLCTWVCLAYEGFIAGQLSVAGLGLSDVVFLNHLDGVEGREVVVEGELLVVEAEFVDCHLLDFEGGFEGFVLGEDELVVVFKTVKFLLEFEL